MFQTKMLNVYSNHWALKICDNTINMGKCRSWWPCGLWRRYAVVWLLGSRVWIPLRAWIFVSFCLLCVVEVAASATGWSPV